MDLLAALAKTTAPTAAKATTPLLIPSFQSGKPVFRRWDMERSLNAYERSSWVYTCVMTLANAGSSVPWVAQVRDRDGEWQNDPDSPLSALVEMPNQAMGRQRVVESIITHLCLTGNSILQKVMAGRPEVPVELWPILPTRVTPVADSKLFIRGYKITNDRQGERPAEEFVHTLLIDPRNPMWGMAPIQAVSHSIEGDIEAVEFNRVSFAERLVVDGVLSLKASNLTREQFEQYREFLKEQKDMGGRGPLILGGDADWIRMSGTPAEMDFMASRQFTMREICGVFGLDPALFLDETTFRNKEAAERAMWLRTLIPHLDRLAASFNRSLVPHFGDSNDLQVTYDTSGVAALQEGLEGKVRSFVALVGATVPPRLAADLLELPLPEWEGDAMPVARVDRSAALVPANAASHRALPERKATAPAERKQQAEDANRALLAEADTIAARISRLFLAAVADLRSGIDVARVRSFLEAQQFQSLATLLPVDALSRSLFGVASEIEAALRRGAQVGTEMLNGQTGGAFAFDAEGSLLRTRARQRAAELAGMLADSTGRAMVDMGREWITEGLLAAERAAALLRDAFGLNANQAGSLTGFVRELAKREVAESALTRQAERMAEALLTQRAALIGDTEAIAAASQGRLLAWQEAERGGEFTLGRRMWVTNADELVCPICLPMDGQEIGMTDQFFSVYTGESYDHPGPNVHINCLPVGQRVLFDDLRAVFAREYEGELVTVQTAAGHKLSATPNHPILTADGWVAIGALAKGDDVVSQLRSNWPLSSSMHHGHGPSLIQEVVNAAFQSARFAPAQVPVAAEDFHGDGVGSKIAVVGTDRLLRDCLNAALAQQSLEPLLVAAATSPVLFAALCRRAQLGHRHLATLDGAVSGEHERLAFLVAHVLPSLQHAFPAIAQSDAGLQQGSLDGAPIHADRATELEYRLARKVAGGQVGGWLPQLPGLTQNPGPEQANGDLSPAHAEFTRQAIDTLAGTVAADKIISIEHSFYRGQVFNLETGLGSYVAEGIVTHNCRCGELVVVLEAQEAA